MPTVIAFLIFVIIHGLVFDWIVTNINPPMPNLIAAVALEIVWLIIFMVLQIRWQWAKQDKARKEAYQRRWF